MLWCKFCFNFVCFFVFNLDFVCFLFFFFFFFFSGPWLLQQKQHWHKKPDKRNQIHCQFTHREVLLQCVGRGGPVHHHWNIGEPHLQHRRLVKLLFTLFPDTVWTYPGTSQHVYLSWSSGLQRIDYLPWTCLLQSAMLHWDFSWMQVYAHISNHNKKHWYMSLYEAFLQEFMFYLCSPLISKSISSCILWSRGWFMFATTWSCTVFSENAFLAPLLWCERQKRLKQIICWPWRL